MIPPSRLGGAPTAEPDLNIYPSGWLPNCGLSCSSFVLVKRIALKRLMTEIFLIIGGITLTVGEALAGFACIVLALLAAIAIMLVRASRVRGEEATRHDIHAGELEVSMDDIA